MDLRCYSRGYSLGVSYSLPPPPEVSNSQALSNYVSNQPSFLAVLEGLFAGFVLIILSGLLRIWGLRSEICRLVPLDYVDYLTV